MILWVVINLRFVSKLANKVIRKYQLFNKNNYFHLKGNLSLREKLLHFDV